VLVDGGVVHAGHPHGDLRGGEGGREGGRGELSYKRKNIPPSLPLSLPPSLTLEAMASTTPERWEPTP
jgi:hypothetical protein